MQHMSSQENSDPQEIDNLGERYHLGVVQGAYYAAYTRADIRRYHITIIFCIITLIFLILFIALGFAVHFDMHGFIFLVPLWNSLLLFISLSLRRKWGNRPFITPESRQERVYLYQEGLIKLTAKRCDVVRWSELYDVVYTPQKLKDQPGAFNAQRAGIQLARTGRRSLTLSGILFNLEELAWRIKQAYNQNNHATVHTDKPLQSPL